MSKQAYSIELASVGHDVCIWPLAKIVMSEVVTIGDSVIIDDFVFQMDGAKTSIGSFIHIDSFTAITGVEKFIIEDYAGLSGGVRVCTGNEDYSGGCMINLEVPAPYRSSFPHSALLLPHTDRQRIISFPSGTAVAVEEIAAGICDIIKFAIQHGEQIKNLRKEKNEV